MRVTWHFFVYLVACLLLATLIAVPLAQTGWVAIEPHRMLGRLAQLLILLGCWPFFLSLGLSGRAALGYGVAGPDLRVALMTGWGLGLLILLALVAVLFALDVRVLEPPPLSWLDLAGRTLQALAGGLLIGVLEETFFRGGLYTGIRRAHGVVSAVFWSALLYAMLHFMKPAELPTGMVFDWSGGFWMFVHVFTDLFQWKNLDSLVALFAAGAFLALVRERTGHIGWCIGLHAGWVFVIQVTRRISDGNETSAFAFLAGDYDGTIGWLAAIWLALLSALYWYWPARSRA